MQTRIATLDQAPSSTSTPTRKPEWFEGLAEAFLGKAVGLNQFGVNHILLPPGTYSSLRHWHEAEDEFVYVLSGQATLIDDNGEHPMEPGAFAGFPAGVANAHHFANRSDAPVTLLVVGSRHRGKETVHYPDEDDFGPFTLTRDANGDRI